jgi:hypothetical protein
MVDFGTESPWSGRVYKKSCRRCGVELHGKSLECGACEVLVRSIETALAIRKDRIPTKLSNYTPCEPAKELPIHLL